MKIFKILADKYYIFLYEKENITKEKIRRQIQYQRAKQGYVVIGNIDNFIIG